MSDDIASCERNILSALKNSAKVKLLMESLKVSGCQVIPHRHMACTPCDAKLSGGYDKENNQIVICSNVCKSPEKVEEILAHELVHLYDYCTVNIDFGNIEHLACTEIRASNLTACSFPNFEHFSHEACVKQKASMSVSIIKGVAYSEAMAVVNRVYPKCFSDLEPIGRNSGAQSDCLALREFLHFNACSK